MYLPLLMNSANPSRVIPIGYQGKIDHKICGVSLNCGSGVLEKIGRE